MTDYSELITRLRETAVELVTSLEPIHGEDIAADLSEAADALEAAQAEIAELMEGPAGWESALTDRAQAEAAELRAEANVWRHLAAEARSERDAAQAEAKVWMNAVADAVEPLGFDRTAACGPADLIPGLRWLVENEAKARAERDAEAALADQLAEALDLPHDSLLTVGQVFHKRRLRAAALAAHRERRTPKEAK